jgi:hypothetical protein
VRIGVDFLVNIIQAVQHQDLFRDFLSDSKNSLDSWQNWMTAMRVLYGLGIKEEEHKLIKRCTGRNPKKLPDNGFKTALFLCGRRSGKSRCSSVITIFESLFTGAEKKLASGEMGLIPVISPTKKQSRVVKRYLRAIFNIPAFRDELAGQEDKEGFDLANGIRIEILTADWRTVRSYTTLAVVVDEVCFMGQDDDSKVKSDTELIRAIDPSRATTEGRLVCISSPYAEKGWAFNTWKKNWGNNKGTILVWRAPSRLMNPTLSQEWVDAALEEDEASARAEYLAEWRTDVASWLPRDAIEASIVDGRTQLGPQQDIKYTAFVDVSGGRVDDSALAIAHVKDGITVLDLVKRWKSPHSPENVIGLMQSQYLIPYGVRKVTGDNYSAEFVKNTFERHGIRYLRSEKNKSQLYLELMPKITSGEVELLDDDLLLTQLCGLERRTRVGGRDSVDHLPGHKDDVANAVAGAITVASARKITVGML